MVADKEIEAILATSPPTPPHKGGAKYSNDASFLKAKEIALMSAAKAAGGTDNITFQLARISESPHRKSVFVSKNPIVETRHATSLQKTKILIIAALAIICIAAGIWIFKQKTVSQSKNIEIPVDTTKIINQQDTIIDNQENQNNQINQSSDSI
jgi:hypothetical protein